MESAGNKPQSQESITFELAADSKSIKHRQNREEIVPLQYSRSSLYASLTHREGKVEAKINENGHPQTQKLQLPRLGAVTKRYDPSLLHEKVQYCLKQILETEKQPAKGQVKRMNKYLRAQKEVKSSRQDVKEHRALSLPEQNQQKSQRMLRKRSLNQITNIVLEPILENYENIDSPKVKENKRKGGPFNKNHEPGFNSIPCYKHYADFKFADTINMTFLAKKLTLDINYSQQKKYLKKITQNRQNMQHPCTTGSILPIL